MTPVPVDSDSPPVSSGDVPPDYLNKDELERLLEREGRALLLEHGELDGKTIVMMHINQRGMVQEAVIRESSGHQAVDRAALRVARAARFTPAMKDGEPVDVWLAFPFTFSFR